MPHPRLILLVAGCYALLGVCEILHEQAETFSDPMDWVIEGAFAAAMLGSALVLRVLALHAVRAARVAWLLAAGGATAVGTVAVATAVVGEDTLEPVLLLGLLALFGGYLALLVLDLRGRLLPHRAGVVLFVSLLASVFLESTGAGGLVLAAGWVGLARLTAASSRRPAGQLV